MIGAQRCHALIGSCRLAIAHVRDRIDAATGWETNLFAKDARQLSILAALAMIFYAMLGVLAPGVAEKLLYVLVLASIWFFFTAPVALRRSAAFRLLLLALCIPVASWALSLLTHPELAEQSPKVNRVANWLLPIAVAFALGGRTRNTLLVWSVAMFGLLASMWHGGGLAEILRGLKGVRVDFGMHNAQHTAMYFGVVLLGLLCFLPRLTAGRSLRWPIFLAWLALVATSAICVVVVQTRAVWLGLSMSLLLIGVMFAQSLRQRRLAVPLLVAATAVLLLLLGRSELVERRVDSELKTIAAAVQGRLDEVPFDSSGIRLRSWVEAAKWIEQRPLLGWGGNGRGLVVKQATTFPDSVRLGIRHLHNSYLDTLVNFGVLGLLLLLGLWSWLLFSAIAAYRHGLLPRDMLQFFVGFMCFWITINFFESYVYFTSGTFVFSLVAGGVLTHIWRQQPINVPQLKPSH